MSACNLPQCHWLQTTDVQDRSWSCTPCSDAASRAVPPTRQHPPLDRRFTGGTHPTARTGLQPTLPGVSRVRPLTVTSAKRCPTRSASPVAPRPVVLSTSSTGAQLRCASAIWPLRVWRRVLLHWSDPPGHAGGIGRG